MKAILIQICTLLSYGSPSNLLPMTFSGSMPCSPLRGALSDSVVAFSQGLPLLDRADTCQGLLPGSASLPAPQACPTMLSLHTYQPTMFIQHTRRGAPFGRKVLISHLSLLDLLKLLAVCYLCKLLLLLGSSSHFALLSSCLSPFPACPSWEQWGLYMVLW